MATKAFHRVRRISVRSRVPGLIPETAESVHSPGPPPKLLILSPRVFSLWGLILAELPSLEASECPPPAAIPLLGSLYFDSNILEPLCDILTF